MSGQRRRGATGLGSAGFFLGGLSLDFCPRGMGWECDLELRKPPREFMLHTPSYRSQVNFKSNLKSLLKKDEDKRYTILPRASAAFRNCFTFGVWKMRLSEHLEKTLCVEPGSAVQGQPHWWEPGLQASQGVGWAFSSPHPPKQGQPSGRSRAQETSL